MLVDTDGDGTISISEVYSAIDMFFDGELDADAQFITDLISFLLVAVAVFIVIKKVIGAMQKKEEEKRSKRSFQSEDCFALDSVEEVGG